MKKALCLVVGLLFVITGFAANNRFDTMVVFGDSLSDNGNLYRYLWYKLPFSPPCTLWQSLLFILSSFPLACPRGSCIALTPPSFSCPKPYFDEHGGVSRLSPTLAAP